MTFINKLSRMDKVEANDLFMIWSTVNGDTRAATAEILSEYIRETITPGDIDQTLAVLAALGLEDGKLTIGTGTDTAQLIDPSDLEVTATGEMTPQTLATWMRQVLDGVNGVRQVTNYAALTALTDKSAPVYVLGRTTAGDGGEGTWRFDAGSAAAANGGTILVPDVGTGRWLRQYSGPVLSAWFGADWAAVVAAVGTGARRVLVRGGTYTSTSTLTLAAAQLLEGVGPVSSVLFTKGANGDMIDMSADRCGMRNIQIDGDGASFTGRGIVIGAGIDQFLDACWVYNTVGPALDFSASDAGARFRANDCQFRRTTVTDPAITLPETTDTQGNRFFINCTSPGGTLLRFNSGFNTQIIGGSFSNLDFTNSTGIALRAIISSARIAALSGTVTIYGGDVNLIGNMIAGDVVLHSSAQRCRVSANGLLGGTTITDNSEATGDNVNEIWDAYYSPTIEWKGDSSDPAIGDGILTCRVYRSGRRLKVDVRLVVGSTTTFGSGAWYFQLPAPFDLWVAKLHVNGPGVLLDSGVQRFLAVPTINAGSRRIYLNLDASASQVNPAAPMTWAVDDRINFTIEYEIS